MPFSAMDLLLKVLFIASAVVTLWTLTWFRNMSRTLDQSTLNSIKRMMAAAEESGYPPVVVPLLIGLTTLSFVISVVVTMPGGQ